MGKITSFILEFKEPLEELYENGAMMRVFFKAVGSGADIHREHHYTDLFLMGDWFVVLEYYSKIPIGFYKDAEDYASFLQIKYPHAKITLRASKINS